MTVISVLVGNPQPTSRTRLVAETLASAVAVRLGGSVADTIDLADHADRLFVVPDPTIDAISAGIAAADVLVVASPTYKASYTGLLKAFLDRFGPDGLAGVIAIPVLTIGSPAHALAVEYTLRPLLVELGASVPTRGLAFPAADTEDRVRIVDDWLDAHGAALTRVLAATR